MPTSFLGRPQIVQVSPSSASSVTGLVRPFIHLFGQLVPEDARLRPLAVQLAVQLINEAIVQREPHAKRQNGHRSKVAPRRSLMSGA